MRAEIRWGRLLIHTYKYYLYVIWDIAEWLWDFAEWLLASSWAIQPQDMVQAITQNVLQGMDKLLLDRPGECFWE